MKKRLHELHHLFSSIFGEALIALLYDTALQAFGRSESAAYSQTRTPKKSTVKRSSAQCVLYISFHGFPPNNENHWFMGKSCHPSATFIISGRFCRLFYLRNFEMNSNRGLYLECFPYTKSILHYIQSYSIDFNRLSSPAQIENSDVSALVQPAEASHLVAFSKPLMALL